jgi:hypothetical protein
MPQIDLVSFIFFAPQLATSLVVWYAAVYLVVTLPAFSRAKVYYYRVVALVSTVRK